MYRLAGGGLGLFLLVGLWATGAAIAATPEPVGQVVAERGDVRVAREGAERALTEGDFVFEQDRIVTGAAESNVQIVFSDRSSLAIGAESEVLLSRYRAGSAGARLEAVIDLVLGILRATVEGSGRRAPFEVRSRTAVASARGTDWIVEAMSDRTAVFVVSGRVGVSAYGGLGSLVLTDGYGTDVLENRAPKRPKRWGDARVEDALERTRIP
ncbi:MAG: FecR family protein [Kiloniellales bacterium]|nr:FecR family protein [Kiloniellales bacterium]